MTKLYSTPSKYEPLEIYPDSDDDFYNEDLPGSSILLTNMKTNIESSIYTEYKTSIPTLITISDNDFNSNLLSDNPNINEEGIGNIKNKISTNKTVFNKLLCLNLSATTINEKGLDLLNNIEFPKLKKLILQDIDFSKNKNLINSLKKKSYELKLD